LGAGFFIYHREPPPCHPEPVEGWACHFWSTHETAAVVVSVFTNMRLATVGDPEVRRSLDILRMLFGASFARGFDVEFWDGTCAPARDEARFTLAINAPFALRAAFLPPVDLNPGRVIRADTNERDSRCHSFA